MAENNYTPKILNVLTWPDSELSIPSEDVTEFDTKLTDTITDMFTTMAAYNAIGLAAPQCGIHKNIIVLRIEEHSPFVLINPKIISSSEEIFEWEEGCLSVPGYYEKRKRPEMIVVESVDTNNKRTELEFRGLYAFAVQHEIDHLQGKTFVDNSSWFKRNRIIKKIEKHKTSQTARLAQIQQYLQQETRK